MKRTQFLSDEEAITLYLKEISKYKPVKAEEEAKLAVRIRKGDKRALDKLVKANLRFVVSVARNYQNQGVALSDLINEGNLGLIRA
ncbi:MAG: RNA polymerase subunit sigma, partial [Chitinivibrionales bacterium]|nr:RNA polymerase subunit sigma [Chitinivibrionales bacterium]